MLMSSFITPLLWAFVPSYLTSQALPILSTYLPGVFPPSSPGSPAYARNYRVTFTLFVCGYLVWSFFNSGGVKPDQNWYTLLAVSRDAEDERLKTAFRTLSRTYHPDRAGGGDESRFILIRQAYETLSDPIKRYAYDRFGPDIVLWKECKTVKDFIYAGIVRSVGFYIFSGGVMVLITVIGRVQQTSYVRLSTSSRDGHADGSLKVEQESLRYASLPRALPHLVPNTSYSTYPFALHCTRSTAVRSSRTGS
ncbi:DnaJ domain-containing protein [Kockovaella imperatae]|uniref:DnaJ domain-containing protein n=1 Tax=Kockovaella imperatae TaxID=4999 RepID=A0A1Y1UFU4_9TREE|nr:DnaJ domain-containing protein [Kockovaella imperatae]ORX35945.1 DnaJ domain-containing protein [Kockovaella imperatae]